MFFNIFVFIINSSICTHTKEIQVFLVGVLLLDQPSPPPGEFLQIYGKMAIYFNGAIFYINLRSTTKSSTKTQTIHCVIMAKVTLTCIKQG